MAPGPRTRAGETRLRTFRPRPALWAALAVAAAVAACFPDVSLDDSRLTCADGRCPDGFECVEARCVRPGSSTVADAAAPDPADAGETAAPDAGAPDGGVPDAGPLASCDEQFGAAPSYQLCEEANDSCEFFINAKVSAACEEHCRNLGGAECITAFNASDVAGEECLRQEETGCGMNNNSEICICRRGQ